MKVAASAVFLLIFVSFVIGRFPHPSNPCTPYNNVDDCVKKCACGWCNESSKCMHYYADNKCKGYIFQTKYYEDECKSHRTSTAIVGYMILSSFAIIGGFAVCLCFMYSILACCSSEKTCKCPWNFGYKKILDDLEASREEDNL